MDQGSRAIVDTVNPELGLDRETLIACWLIVAATYMSNKACRFLASSVEPERDSNNPKHKSLFWWVRNVRGKLIHLTPARNSFCKTLTFRGVYHVTSQTFESKKKSLPKILLRFASSGENGGQLPSYKDKSELARTLYTWMNETKKYKRARQSHATDKRSARRVQGDIG